VEVAERQKKSQNSDKQGLSALQKIRTRELKKSTRTVTPGKNAGAETTGDNETSS
jgi:hypothetical protein